MVSKYIIHIIGRSASLTMLDKNNKETEPQFVIFKNIQTIPFKDINKEKMRNFLTT